MISLDQAINLIKVGHSEQLSCRQWMGWNCTIKKEDIQEESNLRKDCGETQLCSKTNLTEGNTELMPSISIPDLVA